MEKKTLIRSGQLGILGILIFITLVDLLILFIIVSDVRIRFALIGICVFVVNPLIVFYLHNNWPRNICIINISLIVIVWFFTLPLFHELSHVIGVYLIGSKPIAHQLIPRFWEGDFTTALKWHKKLYTLSRGMLSLATNPIPVKAAMAMLNLSGEEMRLPLVPMEESKKAVLRKTLQEYGLLK